MRRTLTTPDLSQFPARFHPILSGVDVYDSSCSPEARVWFVDRDGGYFLKCAPAGSLENEAKLTAFFHGRGLAAQVLDYVTEEKDWLLTSRVGGEDCTWRPYLDDPKRLCDIIATRLRMLHEMNTDGCPVDHTVRYLETARRNYKNGNYDASLFPDNWGYTSVEEAWSVVEKSAKHLKNEVLLHGDYCLPNIMLDNWSFSGFIDLGNGGVGDRHVDLFWGAWTLNFNLKTDAYRERFFDAYGRDLIEPEMLRVIAAFEVFG